MPTAVATRTMVAATFKMWSRRDLRPQIAACKAVAFLVAPRPQSEKCFPRLPHGLPCRPAYLTNQPARAMIMSGGKVDARIRLSLMLFLAECAALQAVRWILTQRAENETRDSLSQLFATLRTPLGLESDRLRSASATFFGILIRQSVS